MENTEDFKKLSQAFDLIRSMEITPFYTILHWLVTDQGLALEQIMNFVVTHARKEGRQNK